MSVSTFTNSGGAAFSSKRMDWETPPTLFKSLDQEFHFTLDAAASEETAKCPRYYTLKDDGLAQDWGGRNGILQPTIRKTASEVGRESLCGIAEAGYDGSFAHPRAHRHALVSRIHSSTGGGALLEREDPLSGGRYTGRRRAIPLDGRRDGREQ